MAKKGRSSDFLKYFWSLAEDNASSRTTATDAILKHLLQSSSSPELQENEDLDYAVKRLVKGLCSSRSSARLGFSTCLTCLLQSIPQARLPLSEVLKLSDESTRMSGSIKGIDERELMFGKLFCYLSIIQSGRLQLSSPSSSENQGLDILDRIIELHNMRGWIKEVTVESMLLFTYSHCASPSSILTKLEPLLADPVEDLSAWQIMLLLGIQPFLITHKLSPSEDMASLDLLQHPKTHLDMISTTLLAATAGFPKIHRVWDFIIGQIFPLQADRQLPIVRYCTHSCYLLTY